jgi:hypothetical protein
MKNSGAYLLSQIGAVPGSPPVASAAPAPTVAPPETSAATTAQEPVPEATNDEAVLARLKALKAPTQSADQILATIPTKRLD